MADARGIQHPIRTITLGAPFLRREWVVRWAP